MSLEVNRKTIADKTLEELKATHEHLIRASKTATIRNVPAETQVVLFAASIPGGALSDAQKDQLETAVGNIAGVGVAKYLMGGESPVASEVPDGGSIDLSVTGQFRTKNG